MALRAAASLSRHSYEVAFAVFKGNERLQAAIRTHNEQGASIRLVSSPIASLRLQPLQAPFRWRRLRVCMALFRKEGADDLVLVQGRIEATAAAVIAARLCGLHPISYLPMAHALADMHIRTLPRMRDWINRLYFRAIGRFIVISPSVAADVRRQYPSARCAVVENTIDPPQEVLPSQADSRARLGLPAVGYWIGMVGRVSFEQKGHDRLIRALASISSLCEVGLAIVGDGPDVERVDELVREFGLANRVVRLGWKGPDIADAYRAIDVLALPSHYEGVPLVMLEALVRRTPVIATAADGMLEWLPPLATFDPDDFQDIARSFHAVIGGSVAFEPAFSRALGRTDIKQYGLEWGSALRALGGADGTDHGR